ncbi:hypothetical protein D3C83_150620 [compost metagenome]
MARRGSSTAIWKISLRFFSPPEKPSFTERLMKSSRIFTSPILLRTRARNSTASSSCRPWCLRMAFNAAFNR